MHDTTVVASAAGASIGEERELSAVAPDSAAGELPELVIEELDPWWGAPLTEHAKGEAFCFSTPEAGFCFSTPEAGFCFSTPEAGFCFSTPEAGGPEPVSGSHA
ncbi:hypothetical protein GCM10027168_28260 [Streptomyces capparidis]|jgi:hypothetical protein